jgi:hypothetical protein
MKIPFIKASFVFLMMPLLFSCKTYRASLDAYYTHYRSGQFSKASEDLNKIKLLKKSRNRLLYNLEAGAVQHKLNASEKSNAYLNAANDFLESNFKNAKDVALSNLVNPMMETYRGEPFEPFLVNYYKAINYLDLGMTESAVVEARKITLASDRLAEKYKTNTKKYNKDPFALNLQGIIYETAGDINNAFIAYRNAANIFLDNKGTYYGVEMPLQLKKDLLRTANLMGFSSETERFEKLFGMIFKETNEIKNELILFIEEGAVPVKEQYVYTIVKGGQRGGYQFVDQYGQTVSLPFNSGTYGVNESKLSDFSMARIALPIYRQVYNSHSSIRINNNGLQYEPLKIQSLNDLAPAVLRERLLEDLAKAFARYLIKTTLQKAAEKKQEKKNEEQQKSKKEDNSGAMLLSLAGAFSEKADTRSWLSLPAYIHYVRIPLSEGENTININLGNQSRTLTVKSSSRVQVKSISFE